MEFVCEKCGATKTVSDEGAAPVAEEIPCDKCGEMIPLPGDKPEAALEAGGETAPETGDEPEAGAESASGSDEAPEAASRTSGKAAPEAGEEQSEKRRPHIGERGEDSLLFDTDTLRKTATQDKPSVEDSGIVDVVKLLSAARAAQSATPEPEGKDSALLGVKRPAVGPLSIAPEETEKDEGGGRTIYAILGAGALIGMALLAAAWILKPQLQPIAGLASSSDQPSADPAGAAQPDPETQQEEAEAIEPQPPASEEAEEREEESKLDRSRSKERARPPGASSKREAESSRKAVESKTEAEPGSEGEAAGENSDPTPAEVAGDEANPTPAEEKTAAKPSNDDRSMESLLDNAVTGKPLSGAAESETAAAPAAKPARELPKKPSRDQVLDSLRRVQKKVSACAGGKKGMAMAAIKVASDGRVKSVKVSNVEEPAASCIEGAVKQAKFPEFSDPEFSINFPFQL
jgi:hypothetical protein